MAIIDASAYDLTEKVVKMCIRDRLLASATANAENNHNMSRENLYVAECFVTPGPTLKRMRPRAQGRAYRILKRTSHITIGLKEKE